MNELDKQNEFVKSLNRFFTWLDVNGYQISLGEAFRPAWVAKMYSQDGRGIANSLHCSRLAIDLNLFKWGIYLTTVEDLKGAGGVWESFSTPDLIHCWGGRFDTPDADHFSIEHNGIR